MLDFKLYVITDRHRCAPTPLFTVISEVLDTGVRAIQLREKDLDSLALYHLARPIAARCQRYNAHLFINTDVRVALDVGATGVHLPANAGAVEAVKAKADNESPPDPVGAVCNRAALVEAVKAKTDNELQIGCSVHSIAAAQKRAAEGADFVTYSPIYPTVSKPGYGPAVGIASLAQLTEQVQLPVFALGGITPVRVAECLETSAFGVAVMSGIMSPTDAGRQASRYVRAVAGEMPEAK